MPRFFLSFRISSQIIASPNDKESAGMTVTAACLLALALVGLVALVLWESLS